MTPDTGNQLTRHADHDPSVICRPALGNGLCEPLTPEAENALIALAVATCHATLEVSHDPPDPDPSVLICNLPEDAHLVHYDPVDGAFWIPAVKGMTRDQAEAVAQRIREAMAA